MKGRTSAEIWPTEDYKAKETRFKSQRTEAKGLKGKFTGRHSYAEVVKDDWWKMEAGNAGTSKIVQEELASLLLDGKVSERKWLERSAVGVLIDFSNIVRVQQRLHDRGFVFTSRYMGGKAILWSFESELDREGFIRNSFFWKDTFISMEKWSEKLAWQVRPVWISISGFPLNYWNKSFFQKLGSSLGDLLLIERDTLLRRRLDRGNLLVALREDCLSSNRLKVMDGSKSLYVSLQQEVFPVDYEWLEGELGLKPESSMAKQVPFPGTTVCWQAKSSDKTDKGSMEKRASYCCRKGDKMDPKVGDKTNLFESRHLFQDKGKEVVVRNSKRKPPRPAFMNDKLVLEKSRDGRGREGKESWWASSSESEHEEGQMWQVKRGRGECSNTKMLVKKPRLESLMG
ncbi:hypothetical protein Dsin_023340 [Dipteronia sinensis]|uniref:DUF4283 domain-containing protein n=1 Tax=Dipteronia sinensis TaxID=43782 RepID=A0AAE0A3R4_9ROSI|nr:hypothetical protein Dsin_023340 [Dipteronia sinensis]